EDGIRDRNVTGVQTCALPISIDPIFQAAELRLEVHSIHGSRVLELGATGSPRTRRDDRSPLGTELLSELAPDCLYIGDVDLMPRSEERRVGKGGSARRGRDRR